MKGVWEGLLNGLEPCRLVTLIGGGGKTSLMYYLVSQWKGRGCKAVAATTTKLSGVRKENHRFRFVASLEEGKGQLALANQTRELSTLVYGEDEMQPGKIKGLPGSWLDAFAQTFPDTLLVVEGDGSAGRSLKGHMSHEPVIPATSPLVIVIVGADVIGKPLCTEFVHRPERAAELAGSFLGSTVTAKTIRNLLVHPEGYLHNCPRHSQVVVFINKVETEADREQVRPLVEELAACGHPQIQGIILGSVRQQRFSWSG